MKIVNMDERIRAEEAAVFLLAGSRTNHRDCSDLIPQDNRGKHMIQKTGDVIHIGDCIIARVSLHVEDFAETKLFESDVFRSKIESAILEEIAEKPENPNWVERDGYREFFVHGYSVLSVKNKARLSEISWISMVAGYLQVQKISKSEVNDVVRRLTGVENVA